MAPHRVALQPFRRLPVPAASLPGYPAAAEGLCGFLVLDKPAGLTSHDCVARVRRRFGLKRVGHGGTLDPAVTGVLPLALGPATRLLPYLDGDKTYRGVVELGLVTSTDDLEGEVLQRRPVPSLASADLERILAEFTGTILQCPPQVSAVHVKGERAHVRARRGESMELEPRTVQIARLELLCWQPETARLSLEVQCSAGTYIRALARDLGERLGCGGALAQLRRTAALGFGLKGAIELEKLEQEPLPALVNPLAALTHFSQRRLTPAELCLWRCGQSLAAPPELLADGAMVVLDASGALVGMARRGPDGRLHPKLVLGAQG